MPHAPEPLMPGERMYRIGVNADCPVHHIYAGGQAFTQSSEKVEGYGSETVRSKIKGSVVRMGPGQLEKAYKAARNYVIRSTRGKRARSRVHDKRSRNFRPMPGDKPALQYMYAIPLETVENPYEGASYPTLDETMVASEDTLAAVAEAVTLQDKKEAGWPAEAKTESKKRQPKAKR